MSEFSGRTYVVTGAASGIGASLCHKLSSAGASIIGLDRSKGDFVTFNLDLTSVEDINRVSGKIDAPLDGLINVAGLSGTAPPNHIFAVNTFAPRILTNNLAQKISNGGRVVFVSSVTADRADFDAALDLVTGDVPENIEGKAAYELSKSALNIHMLRFCEQLKERNINVNCVAPGTVQTPLLKEFEASIGKAHIDKAACTTGGHGTPEAIADVIQFLLANASSWINGQVIKVDGGLHGLRQAQEISEKISLKSSKNKNEESMACS